MASADLWPRSSRTSDSWGRPTQAPTVAPEPEPEPEPELVEEEPTRGYAAWDSTAAAWGGWKTPTYDDAAVESQPAPPVVEPEPPVEAAPESGTVVAEAPEPTPEPETPQPEAESFEPSWLGSVPPETEPPSVEAAPAEQADAAAEDQVVAQRPSPAPEMPRSRRAVADGDAVALSLSLMDELRELIPAIVLSEPATMQRVANDLASARDADDASRIQDIDRLRGVLVEARDKPRDLDALAQLGAHAEELIELLAGYERYGNAIDVAVDELAGRNAVEGGAARGALSTGTNDDELELPDEDDES